MTSLFIVYSVKAVERPGRWSQYNLDRNPRADRVEKRRSLE